MGNNGNYFNFNKSVMLRLLCFAVGLLVVEAQAVDGQNKILWLDTESNLEKNFRDMYPHDVVSDTNNLLLDLLPEYEFEFQMVPSTRVERLMMKSRHTCVTNRLKTPKREESYLFTKPLNLYLGIRLYYIKEHITMPDSLLNSKGQIRSLQALFHHHKNARLGISKGRSYGVSLDSQFDDLPKKNLLRRSGEKPVISIIKMLARKRIDFAIEFPVEVKPMLGMLSKTGRLRSLEIAGSPSYYIGYVACQRNPFMEKFVAKINQRLEQLYTNAEFYKAHSRYLDDADKPQFEKLFKEVFR